MGEKASENKQKYIHEYTKTNYKVFKTVIAPDVMQRIETYCKWADINKAEFLRQAIEKLD